MDIIQEELDRLETVRTAIDAAAADRAAEIKRHDTVIREHEKSRLEEVDFREKVNIDVELDRLDQFDPRKYKIEFQQKHAPYFGMVAIADNDKRIGKKQILLGKQGLMHQSKQIIVDWRKAEITKLFYEYSEGDEYEETIQKTEREGTITAKRKYNFDRGELVMIETSQGVFEYVDGAWQREGERLNPTAEAKQKNQDHRMVDIVSLISSEQFGMITKSTEGCTYLTGGAGSGKTTVALHRLSFLQFNEPELFRQERCLVMMFNRTLRDYVKKTSVELLGKTKVDTFNAWALPALQALGASGLTMEAADDLAQAKKNSTMVQLLADYVASSKAPVAPVRDLWCFYGQPATLKHLSGGRQNIAEALVESYRSKYREHSKAISFSDAGILLRLLQLRKSPEAIVTSALNWYDHILIDEAQDFSQIELEAIAGAAGKRKSLTVCADEKQKIIGFVDASGLASFKLSLARAGLEKEQLSISYRSARAIMALAAAVSGRQNESGNTADGAVEFHRHSHLDDAVAKVKAIASKLYEEAPGSLTAIICKKKADATYLRNALKGIAGLATGDELSFNPGIAITNVHQTKGLEFTNVILWDPCEKDYRTTVNDKNLLYVAITRACQRLDIIYWQPLSAALAPHAPTA